MKRETMLVGTLAVAFGLLNMATAQAAGDGHAATAGSGAAAGAASAAVDRAGTPRRSPPRLIQIAARSSPATVTACRVRVA